MEPQVKYGDARLTASTPGLPPQIREAEEKKLSVRERLARIRAEFDALLNENAQQPEALRCVRLRRTHSPWCMAP